MEGSSGDGTDSISVVNPVRRLKRTASELGIYRPVVAENRKEWPALKNKNAALPKGKSGVLFVRDA
jgi:hypothetical protein